MSLIRPVTMRDAFLDCHADGHQWHHQPGKVDPIDAQPGLKPPWGTMTAVGRRSTCTSCGGERIRWYTRSGEVVNRYRMQDGYYHKRSTPDDTAPSRLDYRRQLVITLFDDADLGKPTKRAKAKSA